MATPFETHGAFSWSDLQTSDPEAACKFYGDLLGWTYSRMENPGAPPYFVINNGEAQIGGITSLMGGPNMPPMWGCWITVADVEASAGRAAELGGAVLMGPADIPEVGRFAVIRDPQGAVVSLITYLQR